MNDWPFPQQKFSAFDAVEKRSFDGKSQKLKQKLFKFLQLYFYAMESLMPS